MATDKLNTQKIFDGIPKGFWQNLVTDVKNMIRSDMIAGEVQEYTAQKKFTSGGAQHYSKGYAKYKANGFDRFRLPGKNIKAYAGKSTVDTTISQVNMRVTGHTIEGLHFVRTLDNGVEMSYEPADANKIIGNEEMGRVITTLNEKNKAKVLDLFSAQLDKSIQQWAKETVTIYAGK